MNILLYLICLRKLADSENRLFASLGPTKSRALELLLSKNLTARDLAGALKIQVSAVRTHMDDLARFGLVKEEFVNEGVGRPKKYYAITDDGRGMFSSQYSSVLGLLLSRISSSELLPKSGDELVKEIASEIGTQMNPTGEADHSHMASFVSALSDYGFRAHLEESNNARNENPTISIISENCPLIKCARSNKDLVCQGIHGEIIKSALSNAAKDIRLEECMAVSGNRCRHDIVFLKEKTK